MDEIHELDERFAVRMTVQMRLPFLLEKADEQFDSFNWDSFDPANPREEEIDSLASIESGYIEVTSVAASAEIGDLVYSFYPWFQVCQLDYRAARFFLADAKLSMFVDEIKVLMAKWEKIDEPEEADENETDLLRGMLVESTLLLAEVKESMKDYRSASHFVAEALLCSKNHFLIRSRRESRSRCQRNSKTVFRVIS